MCPVIGKTSPGMSGERRSRCSAASPYGLARDSATTFFHKCASAIRRNRGGHPAESQSACPAAARGVGISQEAGFLDRSGTWPIEPARHTRSAPPSSKAKQDPSCAPRASARFAKTSRLRFDHPRPTSHWHGCRLCASIFGIVSERSPRAHDAMSATHGPFLRIRHSCAGSPLLRAIDGSA